MNELSDVSRKLVMARSEAYVNYYKAKLQLAEAHSRFVGQMVKDGIIDAGIIDAEYR